MLSMTVAIASYQRREPLRRLLTTLDEQARESPELRADLDIVVVLDGSGDGSAEMAESLGLSVPLTVHWQPNRGLAATRNAALARATGQVVWFLDDDLVPAPGLLVRHRAAHRGEAPEVVIGLCVLPTDVDVPADAREWWAAHHAELRRRNVVDRLDFFTAANASGPTDVFRGLGGFDESFCDYGCEDYEFGARLLDAGVPIRVDPDAVAWHPDHASFGQMVRRNRSIGRNSVRTALKHPASAAVLFAVPVEARSARVLRASRIRSGRGLYVVARVAEVLSRPGERLLGRCARQLQRVALAAAFAAGVADADRDGRYLARVLAERDDV
jgi:GT2 family glycosyltransferase